MKSCSLPLRSILILGVSHVSLAADAPAPATQPAAIELTTDHLLVGLSADGRLQRFVDRATGRDYAAQPPLPFARMRRAGKDEPVSSVEKTADGLRFSFGEGVSAHLKVSAKPAYLLFDVRDLHGENIEELQFLSMQLTLKGRLDDPFAACALALNLQTNVPELPGPCSAVHASCYTRFGTTGAQAALIGCPTERLRSIMQEVVTAAPDLPHSPLGGPWAQDAPINHGSYLFNFGDVTEETVDKWIDTMKRIGFDQLDFHGGSSFRFGDLRLHPKMYPRGVASIKAVIDKLHAAGISAGLHTYAFFMAKDSVYATPRPDPRLGKDATFTLASDLPADGKTVSVVESTERMSTTTGFFVSNGITLQIDDELITYAGVDKKPPYAFANCRRGAHGTTVAAHAKGAQVHHLKEQFGLFTPDEKSDLLQELARRTADLFNEAGFDMIYLDALDGEAIIGGADASWHYGSKFPFEIAKHLKRPALMEMSTFHHHLWYLRSRYIAWDHPNRAYKAYIDIHGASNDEARRMFLPGHLGWWRVRSELNSQYEPTFSDDIEYLGCKAVGRSEGLSLIGIDPTTFASTPAYPRLAEIMRKYEELRRSGKVSESIRARLREPGHDFTLEETGAAKQFRPVYSRRQKFDSNTGNEAWTFANPHARQPAGIRIQMLFSANPQEEAGSTTLSGMRDPAEFKERAAAERVVVDVKSTSQGPQPGLSALVYRAENRGTARAGAWSSITKTFTPAMDLTGRQGLSLWVRGDGKGEVLNVQLHSPPNLPCGIGEHYIPINFTGWRLIELIETEGERCLNYKWPYSGNAYGLYREEIDYKEIYSVGLWYNDLPPGSAAECAIGPIRAIPLQIGEMRDPAIECNGQRVVFRTPVKSGQYLEVNRDGTYHLYGPDGAELPRPTLEGSLPVLEPGDNQIRFTCTAAGPLKPRVQIMLSTVGEPLSER